MSDLFPQVRRSHLLAAEAARQQQQNEDMDRANFLRRLDAAPFDVTDWEAEFIEANILNPGLFTARQREAIDKMRQLYEGRL